MASQPDKILVTGGNGFLGIAITQKSLKAGLHVLSAVRRQAAADQVASVPEFQSYVKDGSLTFTIVPDITKLDAFVDAAKGCIAIIHTASPLPQKQFGDLTVPAVGGTTAVLAAAEANLSVKRVVITSSIYALKTWEQVLPDHPHNQAAIASKFDDVPFMSSPPMVPNLPPGSATDDAAIHRYVASKVAARNAVLDYFQTRTTHFNAVHFMPGYILGAGVGCQTKSDWAETTNVLLMFLLASFPVGVFYGLSPGSDAPIGAWTCHIDDVADAHLAAVLKEGLFAEGSPQCKEYLIFSDGPHGPKWSDAIDIVKNDIPDVAKDVPFASTLDSIPQNFDSSAVEKEILGRKLIPYRQQVIDAMTNWHQLPTPQESNN